MQVSYTLSLLATLALLGQVASSNPLPLQEGQRNEPGNLVQSINNFGSDVFAAIANRGGSGLFISPLSISQALALLLNGAEPNGTSATQIASAVFGGYWQDASGVNLAMQQLAAELMQSTDNSELDIVIANSVWLQPNYKVQPAFEQAVMDYYQAQVMPLISAQEVNDWASNATNGRIAEIVDEEAVDSAKVLLANALYFNATWKSVFLADDTRSAPFNQLNGDVANVSMMFQSYDNLQVYKYEAAGNTSIIPCLAVKLPYSADNTNAPSYSALFAMPADALAWEESGAEAYIGGAPVMYIDALDACRMGLATLEEPEYIPADLNLPRFHVEVGSSLASTLVDLGITSPFEGGDLTLIATSAEKSADTIMVSDVLHNVFIKVGEEGTSAAASTAVTMVGYAFTDVSQEEITFNRPFTMAVVHDETGLEIFLGNVLVPELWEESE